MNSVSEIIELFSAYGEEADKRLEKLDSFRVEPIFEQQTPEILEPAELNEETFKICAELVFFAEYNQYLKLAGLAANQLAKDEVRLALRACFVRDGKRSGLGAWKIALNPRIVEYHNPTINSTEGCLTWRKRKILAVRHNVVTVEYMHPSGNTELETVGGFEALVWQHEINHLDGIPEKVIEMDLKAKPNDPCPCGSSKKFKKCCGK